MHTYTSQPACTIAVGGRTNVVVGQCLKAGCHSNLPTRSSQLPLYLSFRPVDSTRLARPAPPQPLLSQFSPLPFSPSLRAWALGDATFSPILFRPFRHLTSRQGDTLRLVFDLRPFCLSAYPTQDRTICTDRLSVVLPKASDRASIISRGTSTSRSTGIFDLFTLNRFEPNLLPLQFSPPGALIPHFLDLERCTATTPAQHRDSPLRSQLRLLPCTSFLRNRAEVPTTCTSPLTPGRDIPSGQCSTMRRMGTIRLS